MWSLRINCINYKYFKETPYYFSGTSTSQVQKNELRDSDDEAYCFVAVKPRSAKDESAFSVKYL
jgi:hypothetical protein